MSIGCCICIYILKQKSSSSTSRPLPNRILLLVPVVLGTWTEKEVIKVDCALGQSVNSSKLLQGNCRSKCVHAAVCVCVRVCGRWPTQDQWSNTAVLRLQCVSFVYQRSMQFASIAAATGPNHSRGHHSTLYLSNCKLKSSERGEARLGMASWIDSRQSLWFHPVVIIVVLACNATACADAAAFAASCAL